VLENTSVLLARLVGFCDPDARRDCVAGAVNGSVVCLLGAKRRDFGLELIDLVQQFGQPLGSLSRSALQFLLRGRERRVRALELFESGLQLISAGVHGTGSGGPCPVLLVRVLAAALIATDPGLPRGIRAFREAAAFTIAFFAARAIPVLSCRSCFASSAPSVGLGGNAPRDRAQAAAPPQARPICFSRRCAFLGISEFRFPSFSLAPPGAKCGVKRYAPADQLAARPVAATGEV
jgi:hypothetical protein